MIQNESRGVVHSAGHHIARKNVESGVTQMSGRVIESLWAILLLEATKT